VKAESDSSGNSPDPDNIDKDEYMYGYLDKNGTKVKACTALISQAYISARYNDQLGNAMVIERVNIMQ